MADDYSPRPIESNPELNPDSPDRNFAASENASDHASGDGSSDSVVDAEIDDGPEIAETLDGSATLEQLTGNAPQDSALTQVGVPLDRDLTHTSPADFGSPSFGPAAHASGDAGATGHVDAVATNPNAGIQYLPSPRRDQVVVATPVPTVVAPLGRLELLRSYYYIFDHPNWFLSAIGAFVCVLAAQFIPFLPYVVLGGYLLFVIESLLADHRDESPYPIFRFESIIAYLNKAVWPFLISLIFTAVLTITYLACYFGGVFGIIIAASTQDSDTIGMSLSIGIPAFVLGWYFLISGSMMLATAMMLRAGLTASFSEAFRFRWIMDFFRRTWMEQLLATSFILITYNVLTLIGLLAFCVGAFAAQGIALLAYAHLVAQLYRIYLSRGGTPIPGHRYVAQTT